MPARLAAFTVVTFALCSLTAPGAAELSADCKPVFVAMEKTLRANHANTTVMGTETTRGISVDGVSYIQVMGTWRKSPVTVQQVIDMSHENLKDAKAFTCKALPDSVVDGTPVEIYATHTVTDDSVEDGRIAIIKSTGLVASVESRSQGAGSPDFTTHYVYSNVKAPI